MAHQSHLRNTIEHDQMVVLTRLPRVELVKLTIVEILEAYGLSLRDIEREILQILDNPFNSQLYFYGLLFDMCNMSRLTGVDAAEETIKEELRMLLADILSCTSIVGIAGYKLMSIELDLPDTLALGYSAKGDYMRQPL